MLDATCIIGRYAQETSNTLYLLLNYDWFIFLSWAVHISLYLDFNFPHQFPSTWLALNLAIFFGYIPLLFPYKPVFTGTAAYVKETFLVPYIVLISTVPALLLAFFSYFYWDEALRHGYPELIDGQYYLHFPRGDHLLRITGEEFSKYQLYQARKVSGHWMLCHVLPMMYLYERLTDRV